MKKLIALLLALIMTLSMAACASNKTEAPETEEPVVEAPENQIPAEEEAPEAAPEETPAEDPDTVEEAAPEIEYMPEEKLNEMTALMDQLVNGINDEMMVMTSEITADMYEYYAIPAVEGAHVVISAPMIGSIAHEVLLVELPEGADAAAVAAEMEENMDPRKWICVEAEETWVRTSGQYVVMVMSTQEMADAIGANFDQVFGA